MKYYIFKVRANKPELVSDHYIVNNMYIGYVGFDSQHIRSILEYNAGIKFEYSPVAVGDITVDDSELHRLACDDDRLDEQGVYRLLNKYSDLKLVNDDTWYEVYYPKKNSSESILREVAPKVKTIETHKTIC